MRGGGAEKDFTGSRLEIIRERELKRKSVIIKLYRSTTARMRKSRGETVLFFFCVGQEIHTEKISARERRTGAICPSDSIMPCYKPYLAREHPSSTRVIRRESEQGVNSQRAVSGDIPQRRRAPKIRMKISQSPDSLQFEGSRGSFGRARQFPPLSSSLPRPSLSLSLSLYGSSRTLIAGRYRAEDEK